MLSYSNDDEPRLVLLPFALSSSRAVRFAAVSHICPKILLEHTMLIVYFVLAFVWANEVLLNLLFKWLFIRFDAE